MPKLYNLLPHYFLQYIDDILITVGAWKNDYAEFHATKLTQAGIFAPI